MKKEKKKMKGKNKIKTNKRQIKYIAFRIRDGRDVTFFFFNFNHMNSLYEIHGNIMYIVVLLWMLLF